MKKIFVHTPLVADVESLLTRHGLYRCRVHAWNNRSSLIIFDDDEEYVMFVLKGLKEVIELDVLEKNSYIEFINTILLNKKLKISEL